MNADEALGIVSQLLRNHGKSLSSIQEEVFIAAWQEKTYQQIADQTDYDGDYIREIGAELWQILTAVTGVRVTKKNLTAALRNFKLDLIAQKIVVSQISTQVSYQDWGDAEDVSIFFGRLKELSILEDWILADRVRAIAILGMEGIGKSGLAVTLAEEIQTNFKTIIWRRVTPELIDTLASLLSYFGCDPVSTNINQCLSQLIEYLRRQRCLIILDQVETVLPNGQGSQSSDYGEMFRRIAATQHQSCLIVVSRIQPREFAVLEGDKVRSLYLSGLNINEAKELFAARGKFVATDSEWQAVIEAYSGNPMMLNIVATVTENLFNGQITPVLHLFEQEQWLPEAIVQLLEGQFESLSASERQVMQWLSRIDSIPKLSDLMPEAHPIRTGYELLKTLETLQQRCLIERKENGWQIPFIFKSYLRKK